MTANNWDRKTVDIKEVIEQLAQIIDPKKVHWTIRVAAVLGKDYPRGQIADFIGKEVITSLWGTDILKEISTPTA